MWSRKRTDAPQVWTCVELSCLACVFFGGLSEPGGPEAAKSSTNAIQNGQAAAQIVKLGPEPSQVAKGVTFDPN